MSDVKLLRGRGRLGVHLLLTRKGMGGDLPGNASTPTETLTNHYSRSADDMAVTQNIQSCVDGKDDPLKFKLYTIME